MRPNSPGSPIAQRAPCREFAQRDAGLRPQARGKLQPHQNPEPGSRAPPPAMSGPLRPGPSSWRRAATVVLAAGWTLPVPAAPPRPPPPAEGFRLLLLLRSARQGFLPGAHVFPGGVQGLRGKGEGLLKHIGFLLGVMKMF